MPKCTCGGLNPDCYKCGGWGYVGDDTQIKRTNWKPEPKPRLKRRKCPYCDKKVTYLTLHVSRYHDDKWLEYLAELPRNPLEIKPGKFKERCSICGAIVKSLKKHIAKVHHPKR